MEYICFFGGIIIIGIILFSIFRSIYDKIKKKNEEEKKRIQGIKNGFKSKKNNFEAILSSFFTRQFGSYENTYSALNSCISEMRSISKELQELNVYGDYDKVINSCESQANEFNQFGKTVNSFSSTKMMDPSDYGRIQKPFWDSVCNMDKKSAETFISNCEARLNSKNISDICFIDIETVLRTVWFFATEKPYSVESFNKAVRVLYCLIEKEHVDIIIAELYAKMQMGGEDVLRDPVRDMLKNTSCSASKLTVIASALMWMNAYQTENMVLQHMLNQGMQMSPKTQERLHSLSNGGGKAPSEFDVVSRREKIYFDVSSLAWKDDDYNGLFENLSFKEKKLTYSLAVRDEDKDLTIITNIKVPDTTVILEKLQLGFRESYGNLVSSSIKQCVALSGSGEELLDGILVESQECKHMNILVHVARIGSILNIKFYTLYMPIGTDLAQQKQQALSLYNKLSPSVNMWESSIKNTVLVAIQQLLNEEPQPLSFGDKNIEENEGPIF